MSQIAKELKISEGLKN